MAYQPSVFFAGLRRQTIWSFGIVSIPWISLCQVFFPNLESVRMTTVSLEYFLFEFLGMLSLYALDSSRAMPFSNPSSLAHQPPIKQIKPCVLFQPSAKPLIWGCHVLIKNPLQGLCISSFDTFHLLLPFQEPLPPYSELGDLGQRLFYLRELVCYWFDQQGDFI